MAYCPKCGVEVESKICPLCGYVIKHNIHTKPFSHEVMSEKKVTFLSKSQKKSIFSGAALFFAIIVSAISVTADLYFDRMVNWAYFAIIPVFTMALIICGALYLKSWVRVVVIILFFLLMLFMLDYYIPFANFFLRISLPISGITSIITFFVVYLIYKSKDRGTNAAGYIILGIALISLGIDLIIQNYLYMQFKFTWSLITTVALVPIAVFLLYLHHIFSKRVDLKKIFHT